MNNLFCHEIYQQRRARIDAELLSIAEPAINAGRPYTAEEKRRVAELMDERNLCDRAAVRLSIAEFDEGIEATLARTAKGHLFTAVDLRKFDEDIDGAKERVRAAAGFDYVHVYESESAVISEPMLRRAEQLSAKDEKILNRGSSRKFDAAFLDALELYERAGEPYAGELRRQQIELKARGCSSLTNDDHNANAPEHAAVALWLHTRRRDNAEFRVWLQYSRKDHLRRGDRADLEEFVCRLEPGANKVTLSRIVRKYIVLIRAAYDLKHS